MYYLQQAEKIILLICGGDKDNQQDDIDKAKKLAKKLENENKII